MGKGADVASGYIFPLYSSISNQTTGHVNQTKYIKLSSDFRYQPSVKQTGYSMDDDPMLNAFGVMCGKKEKNTPFFTV